MFRSFRPFELLFRNRLTKRRENAIKEAVFSYQIKTAGHPKGTSFFFVADYTSGKPKDPPKEMVEHLQSLFGLVKPFSRCEVLKEKGIVDKDTGDLGIVFSVKSITWINANEATIEGGYFMGTKSASYFQYRVAHKENKWAVAEEKLIRAT